MTKAQVKAMIVMLLVAGLILSGVVGFQLFKNRMIAQSFKGQANPPQTVSTAAAQVSLWQPSVEAVGSLSASKQAALSVEVVGLVSAIRFTSGQRANAGHALVELDPAP